MDAHELWEFGEPFESDIFDLFQNSSIGRALVL